jgi:hypothetical protein
VRCTDLSIRSALSPRWCLMVALLAGCSSPMPPMSPAPAPAQRAGAPAPSPAPAHSTAGPRAVLPAPGTTANNWDEYRMLAAQRIVDANPATTHMGVVVEPLLAIPVLEIELNGNGSVRAIKVMREPSQAKDTTQIAIDAVRRAGPFGDVSRLPKPWRFSEVFLFGDDRRFKPRSLDL